MLYWLMCERNRAMHFVHCLGHMSWAYVGNDESINGLDMPIPSQMRSNLDEMHANGISVRTRHWAACIQVPLFAVVQGRVL